MTRSQLKPNVLLAERIKYCQRLPTLPAVAVQLVELANDSSATLDKFAQLIVLDPALSSKLLRVANSSFYGHPGTVSNLTQAISLLGLNAVVVLSLSFSLRSSLFQPDGTGIDPAFYWRRALLTALASRTLASHLNEVQPEDFLLTGLLQDVGVLIMDVMLGRSYTEVYQQSDNHEQLMANEKETFGFTHAEAGACLLEQWGLPERIHASIHLSHEKHTPPFEGNIYFKQLPVYVAAAGVIADAWLRDEADPESLTTTYEAIKGTLNITTTQYKRIIETMAQGVPEMESLFDLDLVNAQVLQGIEESARELLMLRQVQATQPAYETHDHLHTLDERVSTLEVQTQRDVMTGLYNRAYLRRILASEFVRASENKAPLTLAFIDIDHFKSVNDTFGHTTGDQLLVAISQRFLAGVRQQDTVARYGGEEFVILFPGTDIESGRQIMERVLALVQGTPFYAQDNASIDLSFSAGLVSHTVDEQTYPTASTMLDVADKALYSAKNKGRGRIIVSREQELK